MSLEVEDMADGAGNVVVHDDLRALFRASRRGQQLTTGEVPVPPLHPEEDDRGDISTEQVVAISPSPAPDDQSELIDLPLGEPTAYRLRCDGRRPVTFDGFPLIERMAETQSPEAEMPLRQELGLYLSTRGTVFVRLSLIVPEGVHARPLHKVIEVGSSAELDLAIASYDPAEGWSWIAGSLGGPESGHAASVAALREDFSDLVGATLRTSSTRENPKPGSQT